jgi:DNA-binding SARP family transcriptional activator
MGGIERKVHLANWRAKLFGTFALYRDDELVDVPAAISKSLVAYLLLARTPVSRDVLAADVWPELSVADARNTLSQAIWKFKSAIGEDAAHELLESSKSWIAILGDVSVDVTGFDDRLVEATSGGPAERDLLFQAVQIYRGDLLSGLFDDWVMWRQQLYRRRVTDALDRLQRLDAARGDFVNSLEFLRRMVAIDPLRSDAHRQIMKTLHLLGRSEEALSYFESWDRTLSQDFGQHPSRESRELYRVISTRPNTQVPTDSRGFVGRDAQRRTALALLETTLIGVGTFLPVVGEGGVGKSAFLRKLQSDLYWRGSGALIRSCAGDFENSYGTAAGLITAMLDSSTASAVEAMVPPQLIHEVAKLVPELREHLDVSVPFMATVDDPAMRTREAVVAVAAALASARPLALLLDDLGGMDRDSQAILADLIERLVKAGAGVVVAVPPNLEDAGVFHTDFIELINAAESVRLPRFNVATTGAFVREVRGDLVEPAVISRVHSESGGLPAFLSLLVRDLDGHGSLSAVIEKRLSSLSPDTMPLLEALSLDPTGMAEQHLDSLVGDWRSAAGDLVREGLIVEVEEEAGARFEIELEAVREAVYEGLADHAGLHRSFAAALAGTRGELARFVRHASAAGMQQASALTYVFLAQSARSVNATATAAANYEAAINIGRTGEGLGRESLFAVVAEYIGFTCSYSLDVGIVGLDDLLLELASTPSEERTALLRVAELYRVQGLFRECVQVCQRGIEVSYEPNHVAEFALERALVRQLQSNAEVGLAELREIMELEAINPQIRARLAQVRSQMLMRLSRFDEMDASIEEALAVAGDDVLLQTDILNVRALRAMEAGRLSESIDQQGAIFQLASDAGYRYRMAVSRWNTSIAYLNLDQMVESIQAAEDALEMGSQIGSVYLATMGRLSLASALFETAGPSDRIDELLAQAYVYVKRNAVFNAKAWAQELMALVHHRRGNHSEARVLVDQAVDDSEARSLDWGVLNARLTRAQMALVEDRVEDAHEDIVVAAEKSAVVGSVTHPLPIKAMQSVVMARSGDLDGAARLAHEVMDGEMTWYAQHRSWKYVADALRLAGDDQHHLSAINRAKAQFESRLSGASRNLTERARRSPEGVAILEAWMLAEPRRRVVTLANAVGSVEVEWTISLPADRQVAAGVLRRRHRLNRVLAQSRAAGVQSGPIAELANAFSVSESTIRRDIDALSARSNAR